MALNHIVSAKQFTTSDLSKIFSIADKIKSQKFKKRVLKDKVMATLFYEPSTRTRLSFESAMLRLGGSVISTENAQEFSSAAKGETLEDTIRVLNSYADVIVLRHFSAGASEIAASFSSVPILNAGDGNGEHPTQALLDLYTIFSKIKRKNLTIMMVGDLKNGRTIHSLSYLLSLYKNIRLIYTSPKALSIPENLKLHLKDINFAFDETENMDKYLNVSDVIYQTRIQKERFKTKSEYKRYFGKYIIDHTTLEKIKKDAIIMHPLPRINEITQRVDEDPRAIYFEQVKFGVIIRMSLLLYLFDKRK